ncbi:MAG TPA: hypothetical protein VMZ91_16545 [Candidatus Paceibacterota bacterium]|nr:hypothetical protein [Candidatus Paceibacterota bacterium]
MIFRTGKHAGKTLEEVQLIEPGYIAWIKENRPEMLKERKQPKKPEASPKEVSEESEKKYILPENTDFLNQGPEKR